MGVLSHFVRSPVRPPVAVNGRAVAGTIESYERLANVFHAVLGEQSLSALLERIADEVEALIPHDTLTIYTADDATRTLTPVLARDPWAEEIMQSTTAFGEGLTGWAAEHREAVVVNQAHLDPRVKTVPGTPEDEEEALISVPLIARGQIKGALNIYREGGKAFDEFEFHLAKRLGDAAALALDNAEKTAALEHQAQTDALTGLCNHRVFHETLRLELALTAESGARTAVLIVDLDDFKHLNDVHGHAAGDAALVIAADVIRGAIREADIACRIGGEEFGLILPRSDAAAALLVARRIQDALAPETAPLLGVGLTASMGIAQAPEHSSNPQELAACADASMLTAKGAGKNRITVFDGDVARKESESSDRGVRTIAHLKMLQSLSNRLNRLNELPEIGDAILRELMTLLDYHACRIYVTEGEWLISIAHRHEFSSASGEAVVPPPQRVGDGIAGRAAATRVSLLIDNALECEFAQQLPGTSPVAESVIATPLLFGDEVMGVVAVTKLGVKAFDADDVRLLEVLAGQASVALKNAALYAAERAEAERARRLLERSNEFLRLSHELVEVRDVEELARRATETVTKLLRCESSSLWLQIEPRAGLTSVGGCGPALDGHPEHPVLPAAELERLRSERAPFLIEPDGNGIEPVLRQRLVAPLRFGGDRVGALLAGGAEFTSEDARILEGIADQTRMALTNAEQFASLEAMFVSTVESLANALEANDEYTSTHARAITDMALEVGARVGLAGDELKRLEVGALFHDIGKIGIPKEILTKPAALTEEERQVVERHPVIGERILAPIRQLNGIGEIVRHCHERYDGGGYPDGLREWGIPLAARIIFVCDAYHAMTSDRPYSLARSHAEALAELERGAGSQFDPAVVAAFVSSFRAAPSS